MCAGKIVNNFKIMRHERPECDGFCYCSAYIWLTTSMTTGDRMKCISAN